MLQIPYISFFKDFFKKDVLKASIPAVGLLLVLWFNFGIWSLIFYFLICAVAYFFYFPERASVRILFWLTALMAPFALNLILATDLPQFLVVITTISFIVLFCGIAGLANFHFKNGLVAYKVLSTALLTSILLVWFYQNPLLYSATISETEQKLMSLLPSSISLLSYFSIIWTLSLFAAVAVILRETLVFGGEFWGRRNWMVSATVSFVITELSYLILFLPLGFINSAAFLILFIIISRRFLVAHFKGGLNRRFIIRELAVFVAFAFIIFISARWTI